MLRALKAFLCAPLALLILLCGCSPNESSAQETTSLTMTEETTDAPPTASATADSAKNENKLEYDFVAIKQKAGEITSQFDKYVDKNKFNGVIYMKLGNDFEYISSSGASDSNRHKENSINTCFYTDSLTKQVTAAAVLLLNEGKKLSLDDTLDKYFPNYEYGKKITVKNLLDMTSGIKNYIVRSDITNAAAYLDIELIDKVSEDNSAEENKSAVLNWILEHETDFEPGSEFEFSDSNYFLLGEIIAKASDMPYEEFVSQKLLKPLGMNGSGFDADDRLAIGYGGNSECEKLTYGGVGYSACGFISSISETLKWVDGIFSGDVLSRESVKIMQEEGDYGYSCGVYISGDRLSAYGRCGAYSSILNYSTDKKEIYISLSNYNFADSSEINTLFKGYISRFSA